MASRSISVKVSTAKVIAALQAKLEASAKAVVNNEKIKKANEKAQNAWEKEVADLAYKAISKASNVQAYENYRKELTVSIQFEAGAVKFPSAPTIELEKELGKYEIDEIENAIRILQMTDEETVNASTFKTIAQYL